MKKKFLAGALALVFLMPSANVFAKEEKETVETQFKGDYTLSLIHISEPTRPCGTSRMPSSA